MTTSLATKRSRALDIRECAADDCTNLTRPARVLVANAPGTYRRERGGQCPACFRKTNPPKSRNVEVLECTAEGCNQLTRPQHATSAECPGTLKRISNGRCQRCWRGAETVQVQAVQHRNNVSGLEGFLAARRRRGVPAEGRVFAWVLEDVA